MYNYFKKSLGILYAIIFITFQWQLANAQYKPLMGKTLPGGIVNLANLKTSLSKNLNRPKFIPHIKLQFSSKREKYRLKQKANSRLKATEELDNSSKVKSSQHTQSLSSGGFETTQSIKSSQFTSFDGVSEWNGYPPDPNLAVGPNYIVEAVNRMLVVFNKSGVSEYEIDFGTFFSNFVNSNDNIGDPKIIYDQYSKRYVLVILDFTKGTYLIAATETTDPLGNWYKYSSNAKYDGNLYTGNYPDYTGLGYDSNVIYVTSNQFTVPASKATDSDFAFSKIRMFYKSQLYNDHTLTYADFAGMEDSYGKVWAIKPAHHYGNTSSAYLINTELGGGSSVTLWRIDNPLTNPTLSQQDIINVASYSSPVSAVEKGSNDNLDAGFTFTQDCVWRNGYLYTAFTTKHDWGSGNVDAIQYLKINTKTNGLPIDAVYGSPTAYYFYPNISVDKYGDMAIVFNRSSSSEYGSVRWTYRRADDKTANPSQSLKEGKYSYDYLDDNNKNRWGDYTGICIDPNNENKIWFCGQWAYDAVTWSTEIGSVDFYPYALSGDITSNRTLNGSYVVPHSLSVQSGATLTIDAGSVLGLGNNVSINIRPGAKLTVNGISNSPVHFQRLYADTAWGQIYLYGDGNQFTWTLFDGGNKNVGVGSTNNTFTDCTFRNGWRGVSSGSNQSGSGNSSFTMTDCMVENNSSVGVVAYYSNVSLSGTTIQNNGQAGLWLYNSSSNSFSRNAFISNGTTSSGRDGMEVVGGSDVSFTPSGLNLVANNPTDQINVDAGSSLIMGDPSLQEMGYNSIYGGSGYHINNQSSTTVGAYGNWWGTSSPSSYLFLGSVDYSGYMSYDPCVQIGGCGVASDQYPQQVGPYTLQLMVVKNTASKASSESSGESIKSGNKISTTFTPVSKSVYRKKRRALMHSLWSSITNDNNANRLMSEMHELYRLDLESHGDTSFTSERNTDRLMWRSMIQKYLIGKQIQNAGGVQLSASQVADLMIMDEHEAQRFGKYTEASKKVDEYTPYITDPRQKVALEIDHMNLMNEQGNYKQALAMLDNMEQGEIALGMKSKRVHALYKIAQDNMQQTMKKQQAQAGNQNKKKMAATTSTQPDKTILQPNYPNPFNPTTNIRYELAKPEAVRVTVYNVLGQQVAVLVQAHQQAGWHQATFNGLHVSSGMYFYRLKAGNKVLVKKMLLLK